MRVRSLAAAAAVACAAAAGEPDTRAAEAAQLVERGDALRAEGKSSEALQAYLAGYKLWDAMGGREREAARALEGMGRTTQTVARTLEGKKAAALHAKTLRFFEWALAKRREAFDGDHLELVRSLEDVAQTLLELGREAEMLPLLEEAVPMRRRLSEGDARKLARSLEDLAVARFWAGRHGDAVAPLEEALAMRRRLAGGEDDPDVAFCLAALAKMLDAVGCQHEAVPLLEEALASYRRLHDGDHPEVVAGLNELAGACYRAGRQADALRFAEEALAMDRRLFEGEDHPNVATSLANLAAIHHALGRHGDALPLSEEALAMRRRLFEGDHADIANSLNNVAMTRWALGSGEALPLLREALAMRRRVFDGDHVDVATSLHNLAHVLERKGRREEALAMKEETLAMYRRIYEGDHPDVAQSLEHLAATYDALGRHDDAQRAWRECIAMGRRIGWADLHEPLAAFARALLERGDPEAAVPLLEDAAGLLESRRADAAELGFEGRARYAAAMRDEADPVALLVRAQVALGRPRDALETLERGRGREMLDLLARGRADPLARAAERASREGDDGLLTRIEAARDAVAGAGADIVRAEREVARAREKGKRAALREARTRRARARRALRKALRDRLHVVRDVLPEASPLSAAGLQALLGEDERLLAYSLGEETSYGFLVRPEGGAIAAFPVGPREEVAREAKARIAQLGRRGDRSSGRLFDLLVPPSVWAEVRRARRVYVLPHGPLHALPFEALVVGRSEDGAPRYWVDEGPPIAYAPSGSVLAWLKRRAAGAPGAALVAVADPDLREGALAPLPGTRVEVKRIAASVRDARPDAEVVTLVGARATEAALFEAARGARILHLATHGIVDETASASFSGLALAAPREPVPGDDGFLTLADLLERWRGRLEGMRLVVLSACESQRGRLERDEGMLALPWGFCFAGARSAIGSLWRVDDESTALLMAGFYRRLLAKDGADPCGALHEARRALRRSHPEPYYWAPFVFVGAP